MNMEVNIKKVRDGAVIPTYGSEFSAGADLYACLDGDAVIPPHASLAVPTGLSLEIPTGCVGLIYARSGLATKRGLAPANKVGVIDSDYRGEVTVVLYNHSDAEQTVQSGERVAQLVLTPYIKAEFFERDELSKTVRGSGGFGSTGRK